MGRSTSNMDNVPLRYISSPGGCFKSHFLCQTQNILVTTQHRLIPFNEIEANFTFRSLTHHVPCELLLPLHEIEAKFTKKEFLTVIILWWEGREVPSLNLIFPKLYFSYILHLCKFFMLP